jgi:UDP-3-O-acyl-N-acetylglucosamine deacetylase
MQILYVEKLQSLGYEQHIYVIIGKKCVYQKMLSTHIHKQQSLNISKISHVNSYFTLYNIHFTYANDKKIA